MIWHSTADSVPVGWVICDGDNDTPDLRDCFIPGSGGSYNPSDSGGSILHIHQGFSDPHTHQFPVGPDIQSGPGYERYATTADPGIALNDGNILPPYKSLIYIMKT